MCLSGPVHCTHERVLRSAAGLSRAHQTVYRIFCLTIYRVFGQTVCRVLRRPVGGSDRTSSRARQPRMPES